MSGSTSKVLSEEAKARLIEKSAKSKVAARAKTIISKNFDEAIKDKEDEIQKINAAIIEAQTSLHLLRYGAVSQTYAAYKASAASSTSHDSLHPEIKSLVGGKRPKNPERIAATETSPANIQVSVPVRPDVAETVNPEDLPGYVAPLARRIDSTDVMAEPRSGLAPKAKRRFVIGNVSKWIECSEREDSSTHKWMLYVRGCKDQPDVSDVVKKVRFFIHQTYAPNNVIDVTASPFHLIRRGWGEFPARIQIHFANPQNKPVDVVHNLKLDKTYTGLQTLGSETVVDAWLRTDTSPHPTAAAGKTVSSASAETPSVDQNFTICEDQTLLGNGSAPGMISIIASVTKPLKRSLSGAVQESDCKKPRLNDSKQVLKVKGVHPVAPSPRPSVGVSLLKKIH